jgi:hypothetical protein
MRAFLAAIVLGGLCAAIAACGGASSHAPQSTGGRSGTQTGALPGILSSAVVPRGELPDDEDDDDAPGEEIGPNPNDSDVDNDKDNIKRRGFYDRDDVAIRSYGHAPSAADARDLTLLAGRYYAAAAREDGASACAMFTAVFAKSVPEDYGRGSAGATYLRDASTCPQVLTLLFRHLHAQLSVPIEVMRVRVKGDRGLVLIGGRIIPASLFEAQREAGSWRAVGMLASQLP